MLPPGETLNDRLDGLDAVVLDCDGVLWHGERPIAGSVAAVRELRARGKRVVFVTNNSSKARGAYVEKFARLGFDGVGLDDILAPGYAAARYLQASGASGRVHVLGMGGVTEELQAAGFEVVDAVDHGGYAPAGYTVTADEFEGIRLCDGVGAVVVGYDPCMSYRKVCYASLYLQQPGTLFVATNMDGGDVIGGRLMPGAGAMVRAVEAASAREVDLVAGKPSAWMAELLREQSVDPETMMVLGDRLDTDIAFGRAAGASLCVLPLSGVATWKDVKAAKRAGRFGECPDLVVPTLALALGIL